MRGSQRLCSRILRAQYIPKNFHDYLQRLQQHILEVAHGIEDTRIKMSAIMVFVADLHNVSVSKGIEHKSHELSNWPPICSFTTS